MAHLFKPKTVKFTGLELEVVSGIGVTGYPHFTPGGFHNVIVKLKDGDSREVSKWCVANSNDSFHTTAIDCGTQSILIVSFKSASDAVMFKLIKDDFE